MPEITLIIPAYNEAEHIGPCIESVQKNAPGFFKEIIVVDNASTDGTGDIAAKFPVRVVRENEKGLTHARQKGYESASTDLIAYIDADCRMADGWSYVVREHFRAYPETVALTGPVQYFDGPVYLRVLVEFVEWIVLPITYWMTGFLLIGGNFVAQKSAIKAAGEFDKSIKFYGEDADIGRRLSKVGSVYLRMHMVIYTSMRRFQHDGLVRTSGNYTLNFLSHIFLGRSVTHEYTDRRH
ncbi:MAG: glycosyltransferase family 2 protein [Candidatus Kaiserbacteria bacterium]|nr:glycosyltransferase family 2 protein [Candidatus Kaiserbacteria bacterium]